MVCDIVRRYVRNLTAFVVAKPPCVVFTLCLACLAIALFGLGYYISHNEIVDPDAQKDWDDFLTGLSDSQFCLDEANIYNNNIETKSLSMNISQPKQPLVTLDNIPVQVSVPLKIGVSLWSDVHHLHGNISHLTSLVGAPMVNYATSNRMMNLTFSLSEVWDTETRECNEDGKCKLRQGFFDSCVTILAPRDVLPEWKPSTCNSSTIDMMSPMSQLSLKDQHAKKCKSGAVIYFKHPIDLELREKLSVDERAKVNLRLQMSSYFLFVMVVSSIIYGLVRGRSVKPKKVNFEPLA